MKIISAIALLICIIFTIPNSVVKANSIDDILEPKFVPGFTSTAVIFDVNGMATGSSSNLRVGVNFGKSGIVKGYSEFYKSSKRTFMNLDDETKEMILSYVDEHELFCVLNFFDIGDGTYPDFETMYVNIGVPSKIGGIRTPLWGKDYRLYFLENGVLTEIPITESNGEKLSFETDKLGMYILYFNTKAYEVEFYNEYPENGAMPFYFVDDLGRYDLVAFPEVPEKEGYVFTGWKHDYWKGMYTKHSYVEPSNSTAFYLWEVYASWCPEDEYTPLEVKIESEKEIKKGKEDGAEITLTLSEGRFYETIDENIEDDWKVVGSDELAISGVERIDDTTVKLILSGNSSDKYKSSEIQIEFSSALYISHACDDYKGRIYEVADIQLDENGIKKRMFISDNSITLEKQKRNSGNGGGVAKHTITFETNGGEEVASVRVANGHKLEAPERALKEGYAFAGWYIDEELTIPYNFENSVTEAFTLYAAWEKPNLKQVVLPIKIIKEVVELLKSIMR